MSEEEGKIGITGQNQPNQKRNSSSKRSIQPQQQKVKGVTRIINGPKKNAVIKPVKRPTRQEENVYDRLYNSKTRKSKDREKIIEKKKLRDTRN